MNISDKIKNLKATDLNCNVFDVYAYNGLSMQDLLCQFFTKINECINLSNESIDLASWLVNEGLGIEVVNKLMELLKDGTIENLINVKLFNTLNTKIENFEVTKANETDLDVERKRIDAFTTLSEGSTTGDAELVDARVGADGIIYSSLGNANRTQFKNINKLANTSSCKFVNLIEDAKLTDVNKWNCKYGNLTISNNIAEWTINKEYDNNNRIDIKSKIIDFNSNDVYYCCFNAFSTLNATGKIYIGDGFTGDVNIKNNTWSFVSGLRKVSANNELGFYINNLIGCTVGSDSFKVKNVVCINLSKTFGRGFEPSKEYLDRFFKQNMLTNELLVDKNELDLKAMDSVVIASNSSKYKKYADYITSGFNDQELINNIISMSNVKNIYFTSDSIFNITSEIKLKSNKKLYSNGATFTTPDVITAKTVETCSPGEQYFHVDFDVDKFVPGMYVEIFDDSKWETRYIKSIDYKSRRELYFDNPLENRYEKGATIRNVSSCFSGKNVENVTIEGLTIDWNFSDNTRSNDTFYAQNGIHLIGGSNCVIKDCNIKNGGRHGILFIKSEHSKILNCRIDNWGEHGIDIYNELNSSIPKTYNIIENCVCINCGENGIQLHGGSGVTITNCTCNNNISNGIGMLGKAHSNILSNNNCCENGKNGVYMKAGIYNTTINSNNLSFNGDSGINMINDGNWYTANCDNILIGLNRINNNECCGIYMGGVDNSIISNNTIYENSSKTGSTNSISIALEKACLYNKISDNNIKSSKANAVYGVKEISDSCNYNIIINNLIKGVTNGVEVKGTNSINNGNIKL